MQSEQTFEDNGHDPYLIIEEQKSQIEVLEKKNENLLKVLNEFRAAMAGKMIEADFYKAIQEMVKENPSIRDQWSDLVMTMRLIDPEVDKKFKEILMKDRNFEMNNFVENFTNEQKFKQAKTKSKRKTIKNEEQDD
jgi:hypothetical protein